MAISLNSSATVTDGTRGPSTLRQSPERNRASMIIRPSSSDRFPIRRQAGGYCAEGPGFYVWDEDPREVTRLAQQFASGLRAPSAAASTTSRDEES
jgi:hypothetical protein